MSTLLAALLALLQMGLWLLLLAAALHLLKLGLWALKNPLISPKTPEIDDFPLVTVQLPLHNERYVASRVIEAAARLDWPKDRFEIQVLDDSDDDTRDIVDAAISKVRTGGIAISALRRSDRSGYKAGALDDALPKARGEFIAILDADFLPSPDFLRRLIPLLQKDPKLAFAQGRWAFQNEGENLLTRVQALILSGLMLVEQPYLTAHARPVQFNGTGGAWRKSVLKAAGGFRGGGPASVTEDMDLSYRAFLLGFRGRHEPSIAVPTELPATMAAFRIQQQRWVRGGAEVLRNLLAKLLSGRLPASERLTLLGHLLRHVRQPYISLSLLWLPLVTLGWLRPVFSPPGGLFAAILALAVALGVYYGAAFRRIGRSPLSALLLSTLLLPLSIGLSIGLSAALLRGLFYGRRASEFVRTPKVGSAEKTAVAAYRPRRDRLARLEVALGLLYVAFAALSLGHSDVKAALGLGLVCAFGLLWVGISSISPRL